MKQVCCRRQGCKPWLKHECASAAVSASWIRLLTGGGLLSATRLSLLGPRCYVKVYNINSIILIVNTSSWQGDCCLHSNA